MKGHDEMESHDEILGQVLEGLEHLHSHEIIHRNLKPENIAVKNVKPLKLQLTDFGTSIQGAIFSYQPVGDMRYLAPEMVSGCTHNASVDVWACGMIGCEMVLQEPPTRLWDLEAIQAAYDRLSFSGTLSAELTISLLQYSNTDRPTAAEARETHQRGRKREQSGKRRLAEDQEGFGKRVLLDRSANEAAENEVQGHKQASQAQLGGSAQATDEASSASEPHRDIKQFKLAYHFN